MRLKKIAAICKTKKKCLTVSREENENMIEHGTASKGCGAFLPQFRRNGLEIEATFHKDDPDAGGNTKQSLSAERAFKVLQNISEEDAEMLGFDKRWCRPEWLLIKVLPVPPPPVRPTVIQDGALSQDDLTHVLIGIIKCNKQLEKQRAEGQPPHVTEQTARLLQMYVANFFDNGSGGMQQTQRLQMQAIHRNRNKHPHNPHGNSRRILSKSLHGPGPWAQSEFQKNRKDRNDMMSISAEYN